ncbi:MAG: hypothetical protein IJ848_01815 [Alphaproteobacteria bacterium]|nr:hypothetical protein [Alphaproteobacteria bacterium]
MLRIFAFITLLLSSLKYHKTGSVLSFVLYTISLFSKDIYLKYNWFNINNICFDFEIHYGTIETLICSIICLILIILHYNADILYQSDKYIHNKLRLLNLFAFAMCISICSNNMWQFYISIELLGFISSLFVIIENHNKYELQHATIVYSYNKFASIVFLIGTILYLLSYNKASVICFTIACLCKSAQIPFSNWLVKATSANTLASILIHCVTIIGVGIIFINKFYFLFERYQFILNTILVVSICTSIIYPIIALYETNIKKIMAYLTIASTGTMFSLCALKQYSISIGYFLCHAFFKSLLFLVFAYYIEYFQTKNITSFKNIKYLNIIGLIAVMSSIGISPFIGYIPKFMICDTLYSYPLLINISIELSNCLINIIILKLYLQYFTTKEDSINLKFNIKPVYLLIILSVIYGFALVVLFKYKINNVYTSVLEDSIIIIVSYIVAKNTKHIPFYTKQIKVHKIKYSTILKHVNDFNNKIEQFYSYIIYNYNYKISHDIEKINNSEYKNQIKHLLIGILIVCIMLLKY